MDVRLRSERVDLVEENEVKVMLTMILWDRKSQISWSFTQRKCIYFFGAIIERCDPLKWVDSRTFWSSESADIHSI